MMCKECAVLADGSLPASQYSCKRRYFISLVIQGCRQMVLQQGAKWHLAGAESLAELHCMHCCSKKGQFGSSINQDCMSVTLQLHATLQQAQTEPPTALCALAAANTPSPPPRWDAQNKSSCYTPRGKLYWVTAVVVKRVRWQGKSRVQTSTGLGSASMCAAKLSECVCPTGGQKAHKGWLATL